MNKQELLDKINELEVKAEYYSRTDWDRYTEIRAELKELDDKLLSIYNAENITWLESQKDIA